MGSGFMGLGFVGACPDLKILRQPLHCKLQDKPPEPWKGTHNQRHQAHLNKADLGFRVLLPIMKGIPFS